MSYGLQENFGRTLLYCLPTIFLFFYVDWYILINRLAKSIFGQFWLARIQSESWKKRVFMIFQCCIQVFRYVQSIWKWYQSKVHEKLNNIHILVIIISFMVISVTERIKNREKKNRIFFNFFFRFFDKKCQNLKFSINYTEITINPMIMTNICILFSFSWTFDWYTFQIDCTYLKTCIQHWKTIKIRFFSAFRLDFGQPKMAKIGQK